MHKAMVTQVFLNGERLPIKNFMEYVDLYLPDKTIPRVHEKVNDRWEVIVTAAPGQFQQVRRPYFPKISLMITNLHVLPCALL